MPSPALRALLGPTLGQTKPTWNFQVPAQITLEQVKASIPEVLQVLHPFKPADSYAATASVDVRAHDDAPLPHDCIPGRGGGAVRCLHHKLAVQLFGDNFIDGVGGCCWDEDIAWHAEHLVVRDPSACIHSFNCYFVTHVCSP